MNKGREENTYMIFKLNPENYGLIHALYKELHYHLSLIALLSGKIPGEIYVDDTEQPQTVCAWNHGHHFYLAGRADNEAVNLALASVIRRKILPKAKQSVAVPKGVLDFYVHYPHNSWEPPIACLFQENVPRKITRRYYRCTGPGCPVPGEYPQGFELHAITKDLLSRTDLRNIEKIREWATTDTWSSAHEFFTHGFGYCIVHQDEIVSWSLADHVFGTTCEIGVETDERYRRLGLATRVVSACLEYCHVNGIADIGWDCFETNTGSIRLAEKLGFHLFATYPVYTGWYNRCDNWLVLAYHAYEQAAYADAARCYEQAFQILESYGQEAESSTLCTPQNRWRFYVNAARAYAQSQESGLALEKLQQAVASGFSNLDILKNEDAFHSLRHHATFKKLLETLHKTS